MGYLFTPPGINTEIFHQLKNHMTMKKLFILFAVASLGFVACNNESAAEKAEDSTLVKIDSTVDAKTDSVEDHSDSLKSKLDSAAGAAKDSVKAAH